MSDSADSITLLRPVTVTVKMTDAFRGRLIEEAVESIRQIDLNLERLAEVAPGEGAEVERSRLVHRRQELEWRIKEAESVKDGAELPYRELQAISQLRVGDDFQAFVNTEIVVEDGRVVAIRQA